MHQYTQLIGMTRIPQAGCDRLVNTPFPSPSKHIVLIIDDQFFKIDVVSKDNKRLLDGDMERYILIQVNTDDFLCLEMFTSRGNILAESSQKKQSLVNEPSLITTPLYPPTISP